MAPSQAVVHTVVTACGLQNSACHSLEAVHLKGAFHTVRVMGPIADVVGTGVVEASGETALVAAAGAVDQADTGQQRVACS